MIETDDGVVIAILNEGICRVSPEVLENISQGSPVDPEG
jgi:hypothetical protein